MLTGSYTVTMKFRGVDIPAKGDRYLLHTGKYNSSVAITPWGDEVGATGKIEVMPFSEAGAPTSLDKETTPYDWTQENKFFHSTTVNGTWNTVTIVGNQGNNTVSIYVNGVMVSQPKLTDGAKPLLSAGTSGGSGPYVFCIGGQAEGTGNASVMYCSADVDYVRVYDVPLSEANVQRLYNGQEAVVDYDDYIVSIDDLDYSGVDLKVTDANTLKDIKGNLPKTVKATMASGAIRNVPLYWYETGNELRGYLQGSAANTKSMMAKTNFSYTVRFTYDEDLLGISGVKIDGKDFVPGSDVDANIRGILTFKIAPKNGAVVTGFYFDDMEWLLPDDTEYLYDEDEGYYYFDIGGPCDIEIFASVRQGTVSYYDGADKLGTSQYSAGGNEALKTFDKEGYEFAGWYTDAECKNAFTGLDYTNPTNITLYAKYNALGGGNGNGGNGDNSGNGGKKGCSGSLSAGVLAVTGAIAIAAGGVLVVRKKNSD